uniref:ZP domain-containing protein n=1 Tax=Stegastes partitus TaxID=144197 RepID=A0A3B5AUU9_9TELE
MNAIKSCGEFFWGFYCCLYAPGKKKVAPWSCHLIPLYIRLHLPQRPTWPEKTNPENALQDAHLYHRLPVFLHAPEPLVKSELFLPDPRKRRLPDELTALLLPTKRQHRPGQGTEDRAVEVRCGVDTVSVRVDRLQLRTRTVPSLFRLGSCEASRVSPRFLYFHYRLSECDGESKVVDGQLVYTYSLTYTPPPQGYVIRVLPLDLPIHCHYNRFLYSYQVGFKPQVTQANFLKRIRSKLIFSVTVCNAQWEPLPPGHWFILGEPVYFVVQTGNLLNGERLYVDVCYASASKDPKSLPKVDIITNYGCMTDSRREGSRSQFLSGVDNVLKFSVDSFLFKAASEVRSNTLLWMWEELEALPSVCSCCDSTCSDIKEMKSPHQLETKDKKTLDSNDE